MPLYKNTSAQLTGIKEKPLKLEREIQEISENDLSTIMGIELVKSEFAIKNKRIDSLGFDPQTKAFVIIEYKRERDSSVIDQGLTYLSLMLQNEADFILEYNENNQKILKRNDVDRSQSRVAFVSPSFADNQKEVVNFRDLAIGLWEAKRYEGKPISINPIHKTNAAKSVKPIMQKNTEFKQVADEIKAYTEENLLQGKSDDIVELYEKYKNAILNLSADIEVKPQKWYISFRKGNSTICAIETQRSNLRLYIDITKGSLDNDKHLIGDISNLEHLGSGDYELKINDGVNLEYVLSLVKQAIIEV